MANECFGLLSPVENSGLPLTRQETRHRAIGEVPSIASCDYGELADLLTVPVTDNIIGCVFE
jgi:hypothetical protein